ncbi:MAG: hypothetical protein D3917_01790 [Candidatus Electrothrix sp. AX5]|nr:hypothetical protein [Candidatus Electrothrix sp. AX5]
MNNKIHLILTVDYEIFGNGSGDIYPCVVSPANKIVSIANFFKAPVTFFVESLEFIAMQKCDELYFLVEEVQNQLQRIFLYGHDIQLHLHPQWAHAVHQYENSFLLDMSFWRIGDLSGNDLSKIILKGKRWLEEILTTGYRRYNCFVFRAGGWCIQPSSVAIQSLLESGILIDSTVAPGLWNSSKNEWYDFRKSPLKPFWNAEFDICNSVQSGIWEVPIATGRIDRWRHLQAIKKARISSNMGLANRCFGNYKGPNCTITALHAKIAKIRRLGNVMLDFSTMPADVLIDITKQWIARYHDSKVPIPVVAIAHTKNFTERSAKALDKYLAWAERNTIVFSTYSNWLNTIKKYD